MFFNKNYFGGRKWCFNKPKASDRLKESAIQAIPVSQGAHHQTDSSELGLKFEDIC